MLEMLLLAGGGLWNNPGATESNVAVGCDNFGPAQNSPSCPWVPDFYIPICADFENPLSCGLWCQNLCVQIDDPENL